MSYFIEPQSEEEYGGRFKKRNGEGPGATGEEKQLSTDDGRRQQ